MDVTANDLHAWVNEVTEVLLVGSVAEQVGQIVKGGLRGVCFRDAWGTEGWFVPQAWPMGGSSFMESGRVLYGGMAGFTCPGALRYYVGQSKGVLGWQWQTAPRCIKSDFRGLYETRPLNLLDIYFVEVFFVKFDRNDAFLGRCVGLAVFGVAAIVCFVGGLGAGGSRAAVFDEPSPLRFGIR